MKGFITEKQFAEAESEFPGIGDFYLHCQEKPRTFLELVVLYLRLRRSAWSSSPAAPFAR